MVTFEIKKNGQFITPVEALALVKEKHLPRQYDPHSKYNEESDAFVLANLKALGARGLLDYYTYTGEFDPPEEYDERITY